MAAGTSRQGVWRSVFGRIAVSGGALVLVGALAAGCASGTGESGGGEPEESRPVRLPENLSFVWHDLSGAELNSPAVVVTRAVVESYFLSGQEGDLNGGYPGYEDFVDQELMPGEPTDRHEGTIEFVLVDVPTVDHGGKIEVDAVACYSLNGAVSISNGRRYGPSATLPAVRVRFSLDRAVAGQRVESSSWDSAVGRQPFLLTNVFEQYLGNPSNSRVSLNHAHGFFDTCLAAVNNKTPLEDDHPPVEPFMPGWPSADAT